ncbi:MAG: NAD(+) diphosphatase [Clostridiales bacterium]|nr:NAD(+) diphosphatase [Clostridiales bacterium]
MQETRYFLYFGAAGSCADLRFCYTPAASLREPASRDLCHALMTAWHLYCWYRDNRFCGRCGAPTAHDDKERMMRCSACGNMIFPRIAPAAIIGLTHGDKLLLSRYANRSYTRYGMLAGFIEVGETAEEAVAREVMEEVGLKVKNIRYYKSQPWGIAGNLSVGYYCDLDGEDETITLDENELSCAEWFTREKIPYNDEGISLTGEMIRMFQEGKEPR